MPIVRARLATRKDSTSRPSVVASPCPRSSRADVFRTNLVRFSLLLILLCLVSACAAPAIHTRPVQEEAEWLVRLDSVAPVDRTGIRYEHPATWSEQDLFAILSRLFLEQRVGLMDEPKPVREVFSREELQNILPGLRTAFQTAAANEWVAFSIMQHQGAEERVVTSGGLFQDQHRLHIVVANHRAIIQANSRELLKIKHNPLYSVNGPGGILGIEPRRYVLSTKANWSGGYQASANEMVLDHEGFLATLNASDRRGVTTYIRRSGPLGETHTSSSLVESAGEGSTNNPSATLERLEAEIEQLKRQLADKQLQVERLKGIPSRLPTNR